MKIFIDTANLDEIRKANEWGLIDGVTTNPSLVAKENRDFREMVRKIVGVVNGPISLEVISTDAEGMVKEAVDLSKLSHNIVVKIPMIQEGLKAVKILDDIGHEGMQIVHDMVKIFNIYNFKTEIIVASIRHPLHVIEAAKAGAHVATIPFNVIEKIFSHPLTDAVLKKKLSGWEKSAEMRGQ